MTNPLAIDNSTANLDPVFKKHVEEMWIDLRAEWLDCFIFEWRRSKKRQYMLFWKWRTAATLKKYWVPAQYADPSAKRVTWTLQSKHIEWKAIDVVFDANPDPKIKVPRWSGNYKRLIEIAALHWMRSLAPLELAHLELK